MQNLKELDTNGDSGIDQLGINEMNLIKLNVCGNPKITDVSFMTNLKELDALMILELINWESKDWI